MTKDELTTIVTMRDNLQEKLYEAFVAYAKSLFEELFAKYPALDSFSWVQYRNYFNDGDVCDFYVNIDYAFQVNGEDVDDLEGDLWEEITIACCEVVRDLLSSVDEDHELFEYVWENDSRVVVSRDQEDPTKVCIEPEGFSDHA